MVDIELFKTRKLNILRFYSLESDHKIIDMPLPNFDHAVTCDIDYFSISPVYFMTEFVELVFVT